MFGRNPFQNNEEDEENNIAYRDFQLGVIGLVFLAFFIAVINMNPIGKKADMEDAGNRSRGNVRVEIIWPNDMNVDIDLWCQAPGDRPVGYSNLGGVVFNLVRDDLGTSNDISGLNYEVMFSRGIPSGEYVCNLHYFNNHSIGKGMIVPVRMIVTISKMDDEDGKSVPTKILETKVTLTKIGEEVTALRFRIKDNQFVEGSVGSAFKELRSQKITPPSPDRGGR